LSKPSHHYWGKIPPVTLLTPVLLRDLFPQQIRQ